MLRQLSVPDALEERGISRREFLNFCAAMVATLALPPRYLGTVVEAEARAASSYWPACTTPPGCCC